MSEEDIIGFCMDCGSEQPDGYVERNPFYAEGTPYPCKWCGGLATVGRRKDKSEIIRRNKQQRGL